MIVIVILHRIMVGQNWGVFYMFIDHLIIYYAFMNSLYDGLDDYISQ